MCQSFGMLLNFRCVALFQVQFFIGHAKPEGFAAEKKLWAVGLYTSVQECDATGDAKRTNAWFQKIIMHSFCILLFDKTKIQ